MGPTLIVSGNPRKKSVIMVTAGLLSAGCVQARLVQANDQNYYGTTYLGGSCSLSILGCGTIFRNALSAFTLLTEQRATVLNNRALRSFSAQSAKCPNEVFDLLPTGLPQEFHSTEVW